MDVVYFGSREIYQDFPTAINSLRAHNKANVYAIIEDDSLPIEDVTYIKWDYTKFFNDTNMRTKWKHFGGTRVALPKLFPNLDKILSIDVDTIVTGDISQLWDMDLTGYHVAMCAEKFLKNGDRPYYNNGVCLMNLKQMREDGVVDLLIEDLNTVPHRYVAQDSMQTFCKIKDIPSIYNASKFTEPCVVPLIIHYADRTDWRNLPEVQRYR